VVDIRLPFEWKPREPQKPLWDYLKKGGKRAVARHHRRFGKDDIFLNHTICAAHERIGNYWYMLPEYAQARKSMWDAINPNTGKKRLDTICPEILRSGTNQQEMKISLKCGSTVQLVGSDNFNSLVGSPPVGLVFSEYAISNPSAWAYLMPIIEENNGWVGFNSTPRGKNHFFKLCAYAETQPGWFYDVKTVDDSSVFSQEQLQRIKQELISLHGNEFGEALFQQEYYVSFEAAVIGAIWADCVAKLQALGRIGDYQYNPRYPVHCSFDIGKKDSTCIWFFQVVGSEIYVIDCHSSNHKDVHFYCNLLREKHYKYSTIWLPHDAFHDTLAAGGKTVRQQFVDDNSDGRLGKIKRTPNTSKEGGIQAARATFPRCYFNEHLCEDGLEALRSYHHKWDDEKKVFTNEPVHDWSSDFADSFRYLSLVWKEAREETDNIEIDQRLINNSVQSITMKSLTKQHFARMAAKRDQQ
jgi:hypothetical protein